MSPSSTRHFALLVGIDHDGSQGSPVRYAERDALEVGRRLKEIYGYETAVLTKEDVVGDGLRNLLKTGRLGEQYFPIQKCEGFLFFFAGHGYLSGDTLVLRLPGESPQSLDNEMPVQELTALLSQYVGASQCAVILDACRKAGGPAGSRSGGPNGEPFSSRGVVARLRATAEKHIEILFGCRDGQYCWEDPEHEQGALSYHICRVIEGVDRARHATYWNVSQRVGKLMATWRHPEGHCQEPFFYGPAHSEGISMPMPDCFINSLGMELRHVAGGQYMIGAETKEGSLGWPIEPREVTLDSFYMGITPVTVGQYGEFLEATGYRKPHARRRKWLPDSKSMFDYSVFEAWDRILDGSGKPVSFVSWRDVDVFCRWLSEKEDRSYSVPTECQWEVGFAGRRGTDGPTSQEGETEIGVDEVGWSAWAGEVPDVENMPENCMGVKTAPGRLAEWCRDEFVRGDSFWNFAKPRNPVVRHTRDGKREVSDTLEVEASRILVALGEICLWFFAHVSETRELYDFSPGLPRTIRGGCAGLPKVLHNPRSRLFLFEESRNAFTGFRVVLDPRKSTHESEV